MSNPVRIPPNRGATTAEVMLMMELETNPVTRGVYRQIIGNRIDQALKREGHEKREK